MPLALNKEVFITCAVTGSGATQDRSPHVPRSPKDIADSALAAAEAGAAVVHCHVRDPVTGAPSRDPELYRELTEYVRASPVDVVLNLTTGMGGDLILGPVAVASTAGQWYRYGRCQRANGTDSTLSA